MLYLNQVNQLIKTCSHGIKKNYLVGPITNAIIIKAHEGPAKGHFLATMTLHKILSTLF